MWPLLALSLLGAALTVERVWFWVRTNSRGRLALVERLSRLLREGRLSEAGALARGDGSVYGKVVKNLLSERASEALVVQVVETHRSGLERFMPTLSTIITAAPMLGILGTVTGIISSFQILADVSMTADPRDVGHGIAEALLTTAAGLVIAIGVLFPYNGFRAQIDRTLGRIDLLIAAAGEGRDTGSKAEAVAAGAPEPAVWSG